MTVLTGLTTFTAGTPAVASQVNTNFSAIKTYVDALSAGTNIDNGTIGVAKLAPAAVSVLSPVGSIVQYIGATEPNGNWKLCNGQTLVIASYPDLYNLLTTNGTVFPWGANPSGSTFVVPNFGGRVPVGKSAETEFDTLGETGGSKTVTLTEGQLASHNHTQVAHGHGNSPHNHTQNQHAHETTNHQHLINITTSASSGAHDNTAGYVAAGTNGGGTTSFFSSSGSVTGTDNATASNVESSITINNTLAEYLAAGGGQAHNNLQPYITVNYLIKAL